MLSVDDVIYMANVKREKQRVNKYDKKINVLGINDVSHLNNHLNYLFRTDNNQTWTNELTSRNVYIFYEDSVENPYDFFTVNKKEERVNLKKYVLDSIKETAQVYGCDLEEYIANLRQIRLDYLDYNSYCFNDIMKNDTKNLLDELHNDNPNFEFFCAVVHVDQKKNYLHLHVLYHECMN